MYNCNTQKYLKYFYRIFKKKGISEPYSSLRFLLFKSKYFLNKINKNNNKLIIINHNRLRSFPHFRYKLKRQKLKLSDSEKRIFIVDCLKRLKHYPIQYILKQWYFRNNIFYVDYNILIPRIETEKIIDIVFVQIEHLISNLISDKYFKLNEKKNLELNFLEIGIGSGILFISILKEYKVNFVKYFEKQRKSSIKDISIKCVGIDLNEKCCLVSKFNSALLIVPEEEFQIENVPFEQYFENYRIKEEQSKISE